MCLNVAISAHSSSHKTSHDFNSTPVWPHCTINPSIQMFSLNVLSANLCNLTIFWFPSPEDQPSLLLHTRSSKSKKKTNKHHSSVSVFEPRQRHHICWLNFERNPNSTLQDGDDLFSYYDEELDDATLQILEQVRAVGYGPPLGLRHRKKTSEGVLGF